MANKKIFKSHPGTLMPATDAFNEEYAPAYALSPKHQLAQYAATGVSTQPSTPLPANNWRRCSNSAPASTLSSSPGPQCSAASAVT